MLCEKKRRRFPKSMKRSRLDVVLQHAARRAGSAAFSASPGGPLLSLARRPEVIRPTAVRPPVGRQVRRESTGARLRPRRTVFQAA